MRDFYKPQSLLLDGHLGWYRKPNDKDCVIPENKNIAVGTQLRLAADNTGPLSLTSEDGSLGGITLPKGMAIDQQGLVYLLQPKSPRFIFRFDALKQAFVPLPAVGGRGTGVRKFKKPSNIAIYHHLLYVTDTGNQRVQVFDLRTLALEHIWTNQAWHPMDVAAGKHGVYILGKAGSIYFHRAGTDILVKVLEQPTTAREFTKIAIDREGLIYLLAPQEAKVYVYNSEGQPVPDSDGKPLCVSDAGAIRDRFDPPAIRLASNLRTAPKSVYFCLPASLNEICDPALPDTPVKPESPLLSCLVTNQPNEAEPYRLTTEDLINPRALVDTLKQGCDPLSSYLFHHLPETTQQTIAALKSSSSITKALLEELVKDLNEILAKGLLYEQKRFAKITLRPEIMARIEQAHSLRGLELPRLNLALLKSVYPDLVGKPEPAQALLFDLKGQRVRNLVPADLIQPQLYTTRGTWYSQCLDSELPHCQWDRIELEISELPPGSKVIVSTYASEEKLDPIVLDASVWQESLVFAGTQPHVRQAKPKRQIEFYSPYEGLVQSRQGRYLWLKLELRGDGYSSPVVNSIRLHFPRDGYLKYLPAVYQQDDESKWLRERFLAIFQTEWTALEYQLETLDTFFDPDTVPDYFLNQLAQWLGITLEDSWNAEQKRNVLRVWRNVLAKRGTPEGLRLYLQAFLQSLTGLSPEQQRSYPVLLEGFRERQYLTLQSQGSGEAARLPLWSDSVVGRLQTDVNARVGEVRLVSTGDPARDVFHHFAHQFRVFIPSAWVRSPEDELVLRRALAAEKPAHTTFDLRLVEPNFRVGVQSTLGLDTILGDYQPAVLACLENPRHSEQHLGYDTVLSGRQEAPSGFRLTSKTRLGGNSTLR
jgi:phage tail-like protein